MKKSEDKSRILESLTRDHIEKQNRTERIFYPIKKDNINWEIDYSLKINLKT